MIRWTRRVGRDTYKFLLHHLYRTIYPWPFVPSSAYARRSLDRPLSTAHLLPLTLLRS